MSDIPNTTNNVNRLNNEEVRLAANLVRTDVYVGFYVFIYLLFCYGR